MGKANALNSVWKKPHSVLLCYAIIIPVTFLYLASLDIHFSWDSFDYIMLGAEDFSLSDVHEVRTPGYIWIIDLFQNITLDATYLRYLVGFQVIFSWLSVYFFYSAITRLVSKEIISIVCTILYYCSPSIMAWGKAVLVESLTLTLLSFYIYFIIYYLTSHTSKMYACIAAAVIALVMTFIRPTSLIFLLLTFRMLIWKAFTDKKGRRVHLIGVMATTFF